VVAAGAGSWFLYNREVEKAKAQLKQLEDEARTARQTETRFRQSLTSIGATGAAAITDLALTPAERERRRQSEIGGIESRGREQGQRFGALDTSAMRARERMAAARGGEAFYRQWAAEVNWNPFAPIGQYGRLTTEADRQKELAAKSQANYQDLRREQLGVGELMGSDLNRRLDIERGRRTDRIGQLEYERQQGMAGALGLTPEQQKIVTLAPPGHAMQFQDRFESANAIAAQTARSFGMPLFTDKEISSGYSSKIAEVNRAFEKAFTDMQAMITRVNEKNAKLRSELEAANPQ
jgi:hypothetical protein